jgi:2-hydroxy-6-oxonona-2,4-dienedioate hydrolase
VQTKRFRIHYYEAGEGQPIVLLHGSGPGATGWSNFAPNNAPLASTHRVLALDMPGWGDSDTQTAETGTDHAHTLIDILDELGIEKAALVGNSMGGMTSITTAVRFPERVTHLITMGTPCPGPSIFAPGDGPSEGMKIVLEGYRDPTPVTFKRLVQIMCYDPAMATDELAIQRAAAAIAHPEHLASWNDQMSGKVPSTMVEFFRLTPRLPEITAPTMAIHGRDDRVVPFENGLRLVSLIADSRLVLLNRCGHWAQLEHAAEFNRLVAQFVDSN